MTAQENIKRLPARCYGKLLVNNTIVIIKAGEQGYYPVKYQPPLDKGQTIDEFIDIVNADDGVTIQQRKAMEWGSNFGWDSDLAMSEAYNKKGNIIKAKKKKK